MFHNFHTHHLEHESEQAIVQGRDCWGLHPWYVREDDLIGKMENGKWIIDNERIPPLISNPNIRAIGECGLDCLCQTPYDMQLRAFHMQIQLSESLEKPLIIHCVKALDDVLILHRKYQPRQAWIMHGFRGKPQQLRSLLARGIYVSFGFRFQTETLQACPLDYMLLETDDDPRPIKPLYIQVSELLKISLEELQGRMEKHFQQLFSLQ